MSTNKALAAQSEHSSAGEGGGAPHTLSNSSSSMRGQSTEDGSPSSSSSSSSNGVSSSSNHVHDDISSDCVGGSYKVRYASPVGEGGEEIGNLDARKSSQIGPLLQQQPVTVEQQQGQGSTGSDHNHGNSSSSSSRRGSFSSVDSRKQDSVAADTSSSSSSTSNSSSSSKNIGEYSGRERGVLARMPPSMPSSLASRPDQYALQLAQTITGVPVLTDGFSPVYDLLLKVSVLNVLHTQPVRRAVKGECSVCFILYLCDGWHGSCRISRVCKLFMYLMSNKSYGLEYLRAYCRS